jgi:hypothetical protein
LLKALLLLTAGLIWQFVLVLILTGASWGHFGGRVYAMPCGCGLPAILAYPLVLG